MARGVLSDGEWDEEDLEDDGTPFGFHVVDPADDPYLDEDPYLYGTNSFPYDPFPEEG